MSTEPEQIRAQIDTLLATLPDTGSGVDLDAVAARLQDAHEVLVRALEAVEQAPRTPGPGLES